MDIGSHHVPSLLIVIVLGWTIVGISNLVKRRGEASAEAHKAALTDVATTLDGHARRRFQAERDGWV